MKFDQVKDILESFKSRYSTRLDTSTCIIRLKILRSAISISSKEKEHYKIEAPIYNPKDRDIDLFFKLNSLLQLLDTFRVNRLDLQQEGAYLLIKTSTGTTKYRSITDGDCEPTEMEVSQGDEPSKIDEKYIKLNSLIISLPDHKLPLAEEIISVLLKH